MGRNICIFIDGTGDWAGKNRTHVAELHECARGQAICYYDGGVGTLSNAAVLSGSRRMFLRLLDLATATNFRLNVLNAYEFLVENYQSGDQIYLFGFSRGAFACRVLAAMIHCFGILEETHRRLIPYLWQAIGDVKDIEPFMHEAGRIKSQFAVKGAVTVRFMGLFDTVSSVGVLDRFRVFPFTDRNPSVEIIRHAVSIKESRNTFGEVLIKPTNVVGGRPQDVQEVWFDGVHRDIGGGDTEGSRNTTQEATLSWMFSAATVAGLSLAPPTIVASTVCKVPVFDPYVLAGLYPMTMIDHSLSGERLKKNSHRAPANLSLHLVLRLLVSPIAWLLAALFGEAPRELFVWPRDKMYRWYWPNIKHFRQLPEGAFVAQSGQVMQRVGGKRSYLASIWNYLLKGEKPYVGPLVPVTGPSSTSPPDYPGTGINVSDIAGTTLGIAAAFLVLNGGLEWPFAIEKPFGESWTASLWGYPTSYWVIGLTGAFLIQQGFTQRLDTSFWGRVINVCIPLLGILAAIAVIGATEDNRPLIYGAILGLVVSFFSQFPAGREVVRADRATALCFVPWVSVVVVVWLLLKVMVPLGVRLTNWLFQSDVTWDGQDNVYATAWGLAGALYVIAIVNILQDRMKKKSL